MPLAKLLAVLGLACQESCASRMIGLVTADSRRVRPGSLFVAVVGDRADGHDYLAAAIERGAEAVITLPGREPALAAERGVPAFAVADTAQVLGLLVAAINGNPADRLCLVGITGTNGKTTTTWLLEAIVRAAGGVAGVIGTVNYRYPGCTVAAPLTTPGAEELQPLLARMAAAGVTHVIMETSSHALEQRRLAGIRFGAGLFTNLTRDHLDYHGEMEAYYRSKKRLFTKCLADNGRAVVIFDDDDAAGWGRRLARELTAEHGFGPDRLFTCGIGAGAISIAASHESLDGTRAELATPAGPLFIQSHLVGRFNLKNLVGAVAVGLALGFSASAIASGLASVSGVPGRLERVDAKAAAAVFVDYAHTPDALANALAALRRLGPQRLVVVFGCGGDRDPGKRPMMGEIAGRLADCAILTSDNPRGEDPAAILGAIESGLVASGDCRRMRAESFLPNGWRRCYDVVESRREAIRLAVGRALPGDAILISGKGHENYQLIAGRKIHFDDREEAAQAVGMAALSA